MTELLLTLTPVLVSSAIAAWVAWHASERNVLMANVTQERAKWRERIRRLAEELQVAVSQEDVPAIRRLRVAFRLSLNPWDGRDREITALLTLLVDQEGRELIFERVVTRLELLLKHDWERAKSEASWRAPGRNAKMIRRTAAPRAGVDSLEKSRRRNPLGPDYREDPRR